MTGKLLAGSIVITALIAGVALYYLQVHAFYEDVRDGSVRLTTRATGTPAPIPITDFRGIDADSSPLRYRACFTTSRDQAMLAETFEPYPGAEPLNAPAWFGCFDAQSIGAALEQGRARAFLGERNVVYGFDAVVAVTADGRGFVWRQINSCGAQVFNGKSPPEGCPPAPERN